MAPHKTHQKNSNTKILKLLKLRNYFCFWLKFQKEVKFVNKYSCIFLGTLSATSATKERDVRPASRAWARQAGAGDTRTVLPCWGPPIAHSLISKLTKCVSTRKCFGLFTYCEICTHYKNEFLILLLCSLNSTVQNLESLISSAKTYLFRIGFFSDFDSSHTIEDLLNHTEIMLPSQLLFLLLCSFVKKSVLLPFWKKNLS